MPEGPEVYKYSQRLLPFLEQTTLDVLFSNEGLIESNGVKTIEVIGKKIFIELSRETSEIICCLSFGLDGKVKKGEIKNAKFVLKSPEYTVSIIDKLNMAKIDIYDKKGLEKVKESLYPHYLCSFDTVSDWIPTAETIKNKCAKRYKASICNILLEQNLFCGVGNYIRCDVLYMTQINPHSLARDISIKNYCRILEAIKKIFRENASQHKRDKRIYGKKVIENGKKVLKERVAGRSIYWCPEVQVLDGKD